MLLKIMSIFISLIPIRKLKIFLFNTFFGYKISYNAKIGFFVILNAKSISISAEGKIGNFVRVLSNAELVLKEKAQLKSYSSVNGGGVLYIGEKSVVNLSYFDLASSITIGKNVVVGGRGTEFWTHGYDIERNKLIGNIIIKDNVYIGSGSIVNLGVSIARNTSIGAGTVVSKSIEEENQFVISNQMICRKNTSITNNEKYEYLGMLNKEKVFKRKE